jgi:hypothetical protein
MSRLKPVTCACFCSLINTSMAPCFGFRVLGSTGRTSVNFTICVVPSCPDARNESLLSVHLILFCVATSLDLPSCSISIVMLAKTPWLSISTIIGVKNWQKLGYVSTCSRPCSPLQPPFLRPVFSPVTLRHVAIDEVTCDTRTRAMWKQTVQSCRGVVVVETCWLGSRFNQSKRMNDGDTN